VAATSAALRPIVAVSIDYLRQPTVVRSSFAKADYNQSVKNYTTNRIEGGIRFKCVRCEYSVNTLDFEVQAGNLRTQAATAINRHASDAHQQPTMYSSLDSQRIIWRA
jgi:hypothetical protein